MLQLPLTTYVTLQVQSSKSVYCDGFTLGGWTAAWSRLTKSTLLIYHQAPRLIAALSTLVAFFDGL